MPAYVEREFRQYLEYGILAYGFARARCAECGQDFLAAFSCKGLCPSCNARRMAETFARLLDQVFPPLRVCQWALSVTEPLRSFLEREPRSVSAVLHISLRVIEAHLRQTSRGRRTGLVVLMDHLPFVATRGEVIHSAGKVDSQGSGDARSLTCSLSWNNASIDILE